MLKYRVLNAEFKMWVCDLLCDWWCKQRDVKFEVHDANFVWWKKKICFELDFVWILWYTWMKCKKTGVTNMGWYCWTWRVDSSLHWICFDDDAWRLRCF